MKSSIFALAVVIAYAVATAPAHANFFRGDAIDGPGFDVKALGDVDLARDGTGALAYVRSLGGVDRVFVARFEGGTFQALEQVDGGLPGPSSQPVVGASDGGRLAIVFVSGGVVYGIVRPATGQPFSAPVPFGPGSDPSVDLSINGVAYASFTSAGDVRIVRLDRRSNQWVGLATPADIVPARVAGVGGGRSRVAVSADGIGVVVWGEAGHVFARKMFNTGISNAPQDLTPPTLGARVATTSDLPEVDAEDDSSYAWVVFRQFFADGGARTLARRQRGTQFDPPVAVDTGDEPAAVPRIDLNGRGLGVATSAGALSGQPMAALIDRRDTFGAGARILAPSSEVSAAVPAISENNLALVAAVIAPAGADAIVAARPYNDGDPEANVALSRPELGPVVAAAGFDAASDRSGSSVVAWVQGAAGQRRLVTAFFDRPPGRFVGYTGQRCCRDTTPKLSWEAAFNLWGPVIYEVILDRVVIAQTTATTLQLTAPLDHGTHTWQVRATDNRGQAIRSRTRKLRIDARKPLLTVRYKRKKRVVRLAVRARDDARRGGLAAGIRRVVVSWGDRTFSRGRFRVTASHRYRRKGTYTLRVTAFDKAGNKTINRRTVRVG